MPLRTDCQVIIGLAALLATAPLSATSYVPVSDEALVDQAPMIVVVKVQDSRPAVRNTRPSTLYRVRIERVIKGAMAPGVVITVRVPGGVRSDGIGLRIWGAPRFERRARVPEATSQLRWAYAAVPRGWYSARYREGGVPRPLDRSLSTLIWPVAGNRRDARHCEQSEDGQIHRAFSHPADVTSGWRVSRTWRNP